MSSEPNRQRRIAGRRTGCLAILAVPLVALICLVALLALNYVLSLPERAAEVFGPPAPSLDTLTRIRLAALLLAQADDMTSPVDPTGTPQSFEVTLGESTPSVVGRLWKAGLISNPGIFRTFLQYAGLDTTLQAGRYNLSPAMSPLEIALLLQNASPSEVPFRVLAGWRVEEVAAALPTSGLQVTAQEFLEVAQMHPSRLGFGPQLPPQATLEGFLFPAVYTMTRSLSAQDLAATMLDRFESQVDTELQAAFAQQGLTLFEAVILASIVEREAVQEDESPLIASVFLNRLREGIKLDADPTVQYALGFNQAQGTWWTNPLTLADLEIDSPYNTYRDPGLPPGPIANPGLVALRAVAFPAQTPYFYFRAACDRSGYHAFARTFAEHQQNVCP